MCPERLIECGGIRSRRLDRYRNQHRRLRTLYNQDAPNY